MLRKVLSIHLVLLGLILSWLTGDCFAQHSYMRSGLSDSERAELLYEYVTTVWPSDEIWPQMRVGLTKIGEGDYAGAQGAIDQLRADYSGNEYLPVALHETAKLYRLVGQHQRGLDVHQYVIDDWPSHEYAMWSLRDVALINIELGSMEAAQAATDKVAADFPNNVYIAFVVYEIAREYMRLEHYQRAKELYQYVMDHWPEQEDYAWWSHMAVKEIDLILANQAAPDSEITAKVESAKSSIAEGNMQAADAVINDLRTNYPGDPRIAKAMFDIAEQCQRFQQYQKGKETYEYVVNNWPLHASARWSQSGVAMCHIGLAEMQAAEAAINKLLADFSMNLRMANCLYDIAQQYHRFNHHEKARQYFQSVLDNWPECQYATWSKIGLARSYVGLGDGTAAESIVDGLITTLNTDFPAGTELSANAAQNYCYAGGCYAQVERHEKAIQCYQRVADDGADYEDAWYALLRVGRNYQNLKWARLISKSEADAKTKAAFEQLISNYPDCPGVSNAQAWLDRFASQ